MVEEWSLHSFPQARRSKVCKSVSDYDGGQSLVIECTQLADQKLQRKLVSEWCEFLPKAARVTRLAFVSHTNQRMFDAACMVPDLEWLHVKWGSIKDISGIANQKNLTHLTFSSCPSASPAAMIGELKHLKYLCLNNVRGA